MKIILAVLSPLLVLFIGNSKSTEEQVEGLFDKAYIALDHNPDSSYYYAGMALAIAEERGIDWHQANAKFIQGYVHDEKGQYGKAILLYMESISILDELSDERSKKDQTKILINCGNILREHFKFDAAIELFDDALKIAEDNKFSDYENRIINIHYNKSLTYKEQGKIQLAIDEAVLCHKLSVDIDNENMIIKSWNRLGILSRRTGDFEKAIQYFEAILNHEFKSGNEAYHKAGAYHNLGSVFSDTKDFEKSINSYLEAVKLYSSVDRTRDLFYSYSDLTSLYLETSNFTKASEMGELALSVYEEMPLEFENYQLFKNLSELNFQTGNFELAKQYTDKYHSENSAFIDNRNFIAQQSDKFKIEVVLAGYYDQIKSREQVAELTNWLIVVLIVAFIIVGLGYWRWKWIKSQLEIELRAHFKELAEIFAPNPTQD